MSNEFGRRGGSKTLRDALFVARETVDADTRELYEFGPFRLDPAERKLLRGDKVVVLTPKVFDTLVLLVGNHGHLLEKENLLRMLWPDSFVEEGNLSNNIFLLRKALGDDSAYIETVPKRGYRFVGAVRQFPRAEEPLAQQREGARAISTDPHSSEQLVSGVPASARRGKHALAAIAATALAILAIGAGLWWGNSARLPHHSQWIQLTKFPDSAFHPALSPDGRVLAFIRRVDGIGQVYVKMLPDGEPVQLTRDKLPKSDPAFSPDGSRVAYTTVDPQTFAWDTWVVPTLGGEPQPLLRNASGLVWTGPRQVLFSEIKTGVHMGIVAAEENRLGARDVYVPTDEPAMAHRSYLSPDGKWVLLAEMDKDHFFLPCRLVALDDRSQGRQVGPLASACTSAAWSPDGKWMYFTANPGGVNHIWRQRFPDGQPQQITSGPTEEEGIAMAPDGRSFVTAVALKNTSLWIHDLKGERQVSLEGNGTNPKFTPDGKKLCYLIVKEFPDPFAWKNPGELRIADLESGGSHPVVRNFPVIDYDISADGRQVVMWTTDAEGKSRLWLAPFDRSSPPTQIPNMEGAEPRFGPGGDILFRRAEFVYRVRPDGTGLRQAFENPVLLQSSVSPDGRWIVEWAPLPGNGSPAVQAFPLDGGLPTRIGGSSTYLSWSLDGRSALVAGSFVVPVVAGQSLPRLPAGGFHSDEEIARLPGARRIDARGVVLGQSADVYAFYRGTIQRNLYRIPIS
jgi:DNA-binding winged helix-turn-helix (wHTH) protein/Tol biopolymer transport system component